MNGKNSLIGTSKTRRGYRKSYVATKPQPQNTKKKTQIKYSLIDQKPHDKLRNSVVTSACVTLVMSILTVLYVTVSDFDCDRDRLLASLLSVLTIYASVQTFANRKKLMEQKQK